MLKGRHFIYLTILLLIFTGLYGELYAGKYTKFNDEQLQTLIPSSEGFVQSLAGQWQVSYEDQMMTEERTEVPGSNPDSKFIVYQRTIKISPEMRQRYAWHLYFAGIDDVTEVYFNNQYVESYYSSMTPFSVRIPDKMMNDNVNTIRLKVLAAKSTARQLEEQNVFSKKVFTGIIRDLMLVGTPQIWTSSVKFQTIFNGDMSSCRIKTDISVSAAQISKIRHSVGDSVRLPAGITSTDVKIEASVINKFTGETIAKPVSGIIEISGDRTVVKKFDMLASAYKLWSPSEPNLYQIKTVISKEGHIIDNRTDNIGFRDLRINDKNGSPKIFLNGKEFELKGVDYIEDKYGNYQTLSAAQMERDIKLLKKLGANTARFKHTAPHPYFAQLCDKYGVMMMCELPVYNAPNMLVGTDEIKKTMRNLGRRIVTAYDNHPSLLAYGISEGLQENAPEVKEYNNYILKFFRNQSQNLIYKIALPTSTNINIQGFDFIGLRDIGRYGNYNKTVANLSALKPLTKKIPIFFNYGVCIHPKNHNGYSDPLSVESQANYIFNLFHSVKSMGYCGSIVWSFNDYLLQNPLLLVNYKEKYLCTSGLVDRQRQQRLAFSTLQALFNKEKEPLIHAGSYSEETPLSFIIFGLSLSVVIIFLVNRFKRFREYLFRSVLRPYNFYADIRDQRIMSSVQTVLLGLVVSFTVGIFLSSIMYFYRTDEMLQHILMLLIPIRSVQETIFELVWMPELFIGIISIILFAMIFIVAGILKLFSTMVRGRIFYSDTYTITIWSGTPILVLLPVAVILSRILLISPIVVSIVVGLMLLIVIIVYLRLLRSSSVVFDVRPYKVYIIGLILTSLMIFAAGTVYQLQFSTLSYAKHLIEVIVNY